MKANVFLEVFPYRHYYKIRWGWRLVNKVGEQITHQETVTIKGRIYADALIHPSEIGFRSEEAAVIAGRAYADSQGIPIAPDFQHATHMGKPVMDWVW